MAESAGASNIEIGGHGGGRIEEFEMGVFIEKPGNQKIG